MPKPHLHKNNMNLHLRDNSHVGINWYNMQYAEILNTLILGHMCWPEVGEKRPYFFGAGSSLEVGGGGGGGICCVWKVSGLFGVL